MTETFKDNPFRGFLEIGTKTRYVPVEGLRGVSDDGEMVRDNIFVKREQKYDRRKFAKLYVDAMLELDSFGLAGWRMFIYLVSIMEVGKDSVYLVYCDESKMTKSMFRRGMKELLEANVLAKSEMPYKYWVNHAIVNRG